MKGGDEGILKVGLIKFSGNNAMEFDVDSVEDDYGLSNDQKCTILQMAATVKAYLKSAKELLDGKYAGIRDLAPIHLADPGKVLVGCCSDGVIIRYDAAAEEKHVVAGWIPNRVADVAPMLSQNIIHCYPDRNFTSTIPDTGQELKLTKQDAITKEVEDIVSARIGFDVVIEQPERVPQPPQKPYCVLSVLIACSP